MQLFHELGGFRACIERIGREPRIHLNGAKLLLRPLVKVKDVLSRQALQGFARAAHAALMRHVSVITDEQLKQEDRKAMQELTKTLELLLHAAKLPRAMRLVDDVRARARWAQVHARERREEEEADEEADGPQGPDQPASLHKLEYIEQIARPRRPAGAVPPPPPPARAAPSHCSWRVADVGWCPGSGAGRRAHLRGGDDSDQMVRAVPRPQRTASSPSVTPSTPATSSTAP